MNTASWLWPQWTMLSLMLLTLVGVASLHGKPRPDFNGFVGFFNFGLSMWLLIEGGFFS